MLFLRVLGRGFFGFLMFGADGHVNSVLCVLSAFFYSCFHTFIGLNYVCIVVFLQVCLCLLSVLSLLFRLLFCLRLFLSVFVCGILLSKQYPCARP